MGGFFGGNRDDGEAQRRAEEARREADRRRREAEAEQRRLTKEKDEIERYRLSSKRRGRMGESLLNYLHSNQSWREKSNKREAKHIASTTSDSNS